MISLPQARIWDMRQLKAGSSLGDLLHKRVVNCAYFSPLSGSKILTTSQDNRLRVWDCIFGNLDSPSREIVHSHDFNRHLTPFRAEWDPKVINVVCGLALLFSVIIILRIPKIFSGTGPIRVSCSYWSLYKRKL